MATEPKERPERPAAPRPVTSLKPRRRRSPMKKFVTLFVFLILVAAVAFLGYKYHQSQNKINQLSDPKSAAQAQVSDLVTKVSKLAQLPTGETPTVATVTDTNKLKGQSFFVLAKNGDKVLIYTQAKRAVLYRPSENKVIEIAPLNIGSSSANSGGTSTDTSSTTSTNSSSKSK